MNFFRICAGIFAIFSAVLADYDGYFFDDHGNYVTESELHKNDAKNAKIRAQILVKIAAQAYKNEDYIAARNNYKLACDLGNALGCAGVGTLYERGLGVIVDLKKAIAFYSLACKKNDAFGCFHLSLLNQGEIAVTRLQEDCDDAKDTACVQLGWLFYKGHSIPKNENKALELFKKACDLQSAIGCFNVGTIYDRGSEDIDPDPEAALSYFQLAKRYFADKCKKGDENSCDLLKTGTYLQLLL